MHSLLQIHKSCISNRQFLQATAIYREIFFSPRKVFVATNLHIQKLNMFRIVKWTLCHRVIIIGRGVKKIYLRQSFTVEKKNFTHENLHYYTIIIIIIIWKIFILHFDNSEIYIIYLSHCDDSVLYISMSSKSLYMCFIQVLEDYSLRLLSPTPTDSGSYHCTASFSVLSQRSTPKHVHVLEGM